MNSKNRKIKVTSCLNCPYAETNESCVDKAKDTFVCTHPSFKVPNIPTPQVYIDNAMSGQEPQCYSQFVPDWCPLDIDIQFYPYPTCNS